MICPHCGRDSDRPELTASMVALRQHLGEWRYVADLAQLTGISRRTVRISLRRMQRMGLVERHTGCVPRAFWRLVRGDVSVNGDKTQA